MNYGHIPREPNEADIAAFVDALFRYADDGTYVSLRAFDQFDRGAPPPYIRAVRINGAGLDPIIAEAVAGARASANASAPRVFAPPIATFDIATRAAETNLANGVCISVELDEGDTKKAAESLTNLIGLPTVIVASGGQWTDPETGEIHPKIHVHWRLSEPTRELDEHAQLKHARRLACALVNADPTAKTSVHPLRWPGTWHLKGSPRLAHIVTLNQSAEVHLQEALDRLEDAVEAAGTREEGRRDPRPGAEPQASIPLLAEAMARIPNAPAPAGAGDHWDDWIRMGLCIFRATGGDAKGLEIWRAWSRKSPKHDDGACDERWDHFRTSPPTKGGAGTIFYLAKLHGWTRPAPTPGKETEAPSGRSNAETPRGLEFVDPRALSGRLIPERQWIVADWLPVGVVTANYGDGGVGKTLLAQQLMTATATGLPWCGLAVERCVSLGIFCEDDNDELHRRQAKINAGLRIGFDDLGDMRWASGVGLDNLLVSFDSNNRAHVAERVAVIEAQAKRIGARLIVLDTGADMFGGNENDRSQVRQFVGAILGRMALNLNAAVLLNVHPSRSGMSSTGDMDGGSTAWSNTVRSRWSLTRPAADEGAQDTDERILTRRKANYAAIGTTIKLRWANGVLVPTQPGGTTLGGSSEAASPGSAELTFLELLDRCGAQGMYVSHSNRSGNFAPKIFSKRPDRAGYTAKELEAAMHRLFTAQAIMVERYKAANRKPADRISRAADRGPVEDASA